MDALALFGIGFIGSVVWVVSPEAAAAYYGSERGWPPLLVGVVCAAGQSAMLIALYVFGQGLARIWPGFARVCQRVRDRFEMRLRRGPILVAVASGVLGVPPVSATVVLARGLGIGSLPLLPVLALGRVLRFTVLAAIGSNLPRF